MNFLHKQITPKFFLITIFFFLLISNVFAELRIGSFNTKFLGCNSCKDVQKLSKIIKNEDFSIVALQEVLNEGGVVDLVNYLGKGWEYIVSEPVGRNKKEYYAFIWRGDKKVGLGSSLLWNDSTDDFIREPFIAEFYHNSKIYWLINIHILFKNQNSDGIKARIREIKKLEKVFTWVNKTTKISGNNSYTIILGDFNLSTKDINQLALPFRSYQDDETTISYKKGRYASNYDHFCLSEDDYYRLKKPDILRVDAPKEYLKNDFKEYWKKVSDHVPIRMDIDKKTGLLVKGKDALKGLISIVKPK